MGDIDAPIRVVVLYALPARQVMVPLHLPAGSTTGDAVLLSGLIEQFPDVGQRPELARFGKPIEWHVLLKDHDRIDILRPLLADPKEFRRRRAELQRARPGKR